METTAVLYRMVLPDHTCPFGLKAKKLLEQHGLSFQDVLLCSRDEVNAFKEKFGVATTPQIFIGGKKIGGSEELEHYLGDDEL